MRTKPRTYAIITYKGVLIAVRPRELQPSDHVLAYVKASSPQGALIRWNHR